MKITHLTFTCIILFFCSSIIFAQDYSEDDDDYWDDDPWADQDDGEFSVYQTDLPSIGDQTFNISLGTVFPAVFINNGSTIDHNFSPPVGGTGSLSYNFFLGPHLNIGAEIGGLFISTIGLNTAFFIPLGANIAYQFVFKRFEFPVGLGLGMIWHRYLDLAYYGFYMKATGSAYFRFNEDWSFGLTTGWSWYPEWTDESSKDVHGNFVNLMLSARYHF
jgi:hypothetical protein